MNRLKKLMSVVLVLGLLLSISASTFASSQPKPSLLLDEAEVSLDHAIYIDENGKVMCPLREISEKLGYQVLWDNRDWSITLSKESQTIKLNIGDAKVYGNGDVINLNTPPILKESKTFVPVEFFSQALDLIVGWNGKHQILKINIPKENKEAYFTLSNDKEKQEELDEYMKTLVKRHNFHGSLLVAKDGEILLNKGYGLADFEQNTKIIPQTKFAVGSVTKQFTAMAIMQLKEKGLLNIQDKLSKFFPDFPNGDLITIHNLLTHTSGLENYTDLNEFFLIDMDNRDPMLVIDLVKDMPLKFNPGEKFEYSNTNYVLLGMIVEKLTGMSFDEYLQVNILEPLNMVNTGTYLAENKQVYHATPYVGFLEVYPIDDEIVLTQAYGAGNMYSTVEDLYRWERALKTEKLVTKETLDEIFTEYIPIEEGASYGYGWMIQYTDIGKLIYHGGNTLGFTAHIARFIEEDLVIIILTNKVGYDTATLTNTLASIVLDKDYEMPEILEEIEIEDPSIYDSYVGKYEFTDGAYINITKIEDRLYAQITGQAAFQLLPLSHNRFFSKEVDVRIEFIENEEGIVTELVFKQAGITLACKKVEEVKEVEVDPEIYDAYVGEYELAPNVIITITKEENRLYAQITGQDKYEIFPKSETEYFYKVVDAQITFEKDDEGNVTGLIFHQYGLDMPAPKIK